MPGMFNRREGLAECEDCDWTRPTQGGSYAEAAATRGHSIVAHPQWRTQIAEARFLDRRDPAYSSGSTEGVDRG